MLSKTTLEIHNLSVFAAFYFSNTDWVHQLLLYVTAIIERCYSFIMLFRKPRVGLDITAYCGKCKTERTHTVAAMDGDMVRKVTCSMCNSTHNFKVKDTVKKESTKSVGRPPKSGGRRSKEPEYSIDPAKPIRSYNLDTNFSVGDVINHPKFGLGSVEATYLPNKVEVRFLEGKKTLIHNMKNCR